VGERCYLLPDERRAAVFEGLRKQVGLNASAILKADPAVLLGLAKMGGMRPETRVSRWLEIAHITMSQFDGNLDSILKQPYDKAKKALKQFPSIGDPAPRKFCSSVDPHPGCRWNRTDCVCSRAWVSARPKELWRDIPFRAGRRARPIASRRSSSGARSSAAARAWQDDLPEQWSAVPRVSD